MVRIIETGVLVIGGGAAAARAAIEAQQADAETTIVVKGRFGVRGLRGNGATSYGLRYLYFPVAGRPVKPSEEREIVFKRIIQAGLGTADRHMVRILVDESLEDRKALEKWGVVRPSTIYPLNKGATVQTGGISRWIDPMPGLANVIRGDGKITVLEHTMVTDLLIQDGTCVGAIGIDEESGEPFLIKASSTIMATGGYAQLFRVNFHPSCVTGDGYTMGYNAGAELMNMEFMQIFPAIVYPTANVLGSLAWEIHPKILNFNGQEFIQNYLPEGITIEECMYHHSKHGPFSTGDVGKYIEIAITKEIKAGYATEHDACYLEVSALRRLPKSMQQWYSYRGIDFDKEYAEVSVGHHCSNGGLIIDEHGQTTTPGLYAVGETATGPHGVDRLGGGMMAFCQVFGRRAGKHAAAAARAKGLPVASNQTAESQLKYIAGLKQSKGDQKPLELMNLLKKSTWENLLAVRSKDGLIQLLGEIARIRNELIPRVSVENATDLVQTLELTNLLQVGEIIANVALMRTETRGNHYRDDFTERDDKNWAQVITVKKIAGKMQLDPRKIDDKWSDKPEDLGEGWWG